MVHLPISIRGLLMTALCLLVAVTHAAPQNATVPGNGGGGYRIAGIVVSKADGNPLGRARITVTDANDSKRSQSVVTAEDGKFSFSGVPAGKYSLDGAKRGFIRAAYDQHDEFSTAIVNGVGLDTESLVLRLAPDAVIAGKVLDEVGEPVRHAMLTLYSDDHSAGVDQIHQVRTAQTDDQGAYEMTPLQPGTYFLSASATPWYAIHPHSKGDGESGQTESASGVDRLLDVAYPLTYYSDVTDADSAMPIPIRGGERLQVDFHLNPVPSLHVFFRAPDGGKRGFIIPQLQEPAFDSFTFLQTNVTRVASRDLVEVTGIPAGRYNVRFAGPDGGLQMTGVDLTTDGEEVDTSKSEALSTVKVSVRIPGEAALPSDLIVGLRSGHRVGTSFQMVSAKGEAEMEQVAAGRYEVLVQASGKRYYITHISAEGANVSGRTLTVSAGSTATLSLTLASGSLDVQGTAKRAGKPFAGAMVVLVPKDPEDNRDLFRRDQSDLDGTFRLRDVLPGSYTLLAIENGWDLNWAQPAVISAYAKHGRSVRIGGQGEHSINVTEPVDVQSK